jgi:hypothetical protein
VGRREDKKRDNRIAMEIIVDAYGPQEQAMGWYYYLEEKLIPGFTANCVKKRQISPLEPGDRVEVLGMADMGECEHEMFVRIRWERHGLAVPLSQLKPTTSTDKELKQAVEDWHYWVEMGYEL